MASKNNHSKRSRKTNDRSKPGMYAVNRRSEFLTMQRRRMKEMKEGG